MSIASARVGWRRGGDREQRGVSVHARGRSGGEVSRRGRGQLPRAGEVGHELHVGRSASRSARIYGHSTCPPQRLRAAASTRPHASRRWVSSVSRFATHPRDVSIACTVSRPGAGSRPRAGTASGHARPMRDEGTRAWRRSGSVRAGPRSSAEETAVGERGRKVDHPATGPRGSAASTSAYASVLGPPSARYAPRRAPAPPSYGGNRGPRATRPVRDSVVVVRPSRARQAPTGLHQPSRGPGARAAPGAFGPVRSCASCAPEQTVKLRLSPRPVALCRHHEVSHDRRFGG